MFSLNPKFRKETHVIPKIIDVILNLGEIRLQTCDDTPAHIYIFLIPFLISFSKIFLNMKKTQREIKTYVMVVSFWTVSVLGVRCQSTVTSDPGRK